LFLIFYKLCNILIRENNNNFVKRWTLYLPKFRHQPKVLAYVRARQSEDDCQQRLNKTLFNNQNYPD